ncbi:uncharacterized protein CPUR_08494 [Claviceps purpurea 20.1]|uniref:DDE-1 domain-containing protein n=1 Tax=Claviceps purpurea (strain 20.1) TaxID=1111077 RepID=M1W6D7_CLAP2|nr:uncharacterized protein CPUR_08494 [Claviceps purpurea 20.1]
MRLRRHTNIFHAKRASPQEARKKAVEDRATITSWFEAWSKYLNEYKRLKENIWNLDETGFVVGYLHHGSLVWIFNEVDNPVLLNSHDRVSVTAIEAVSAAGRAIPSFIIIPGVNIPEKWIENDLEGVTILATSPEGYISDILAFEWLQHFARQT